MLYGISQIYGLLGTTRFDEIAISLAALPELSPGLIIGIVFLISGLAFKIAAVPFHMWAPDVYEGAPTPITAYLAVGSKAAAFALILRLFSEALIPFISDWQIIIAIFAALTMTVGNLGALVQTNIKRLLAYSSIGHVGYLLLGIAALARVDGGETVSVATMHLAANGVMLHIVAYAAANLTVFLVITAIYKTPGNETLSGLAGLGRRSPFLAMVLAGSILSLAGLPVFAGFVSKFYLFTAAATQGLLWLVGIAIFTSLISLYYYLQILRQMYIEPVVDDTPVPISNLVLAVLVILFAGTVFIGIYPAPLVDAIQYASDAISTMSSGGVELAHTLDWAWRPLLDFTLDLA
jgi:NADH-quinone oxidoreductase subunit N